MTSVTLLFQNRKSNTLFAQRKLMKENDNFQHNPAVFSAATDSENEISYMLRRKKNKNIFFGLNHHHYDRNCLS